MGSLSIALASFQTGTVPDDSGFVKELLTVTGVSSAAGDTGTYTSIMKQPQRVEGGPLSYSISGQTVTLMDEAGLGTAVTGATVYGFQ
jgi:hypothetical protein